jgi:hypothetical protein
MMTVVERPFTAVMKSLVDVEANRQQASAAV